jgi:hypothetical protein
MIEEFERIIQEVCHVSFVDVSELSDKTSRRDVICARILACYYCYKCLPDYHYVAKSIGLNNKQVYRYVMAYYQRIKTDPILKHFDAKCQNVVDQKVL